MSDLLTIPMQDDFETTLQSTWSGGTGSVSVNSVPTATMPSGKYSYIVVNPGEANMQVAKIDGWNGTSKTFNVTSVSVKKGAGIDYTTQSHAAGATVRFSNNYAFWEDIMTAINSKADSTDFGNIEITNSEIHSDNVMSFSDGETAEITLKQLATQSGADQYFAISENDTIVGHFEDKVLSGTGITQTKNNPGANETMTLAVDTSVIATKDDINNIPAPSSFIITSDYLLGEPVTDITKSCLFKETAPTFAQASTAQNVGDVAGNTRVSFPAIGTGVASNSLKLSLAKNGSPSAFLRVRIETDNAGVPSGTLVDANATKDIDPATLTTSLADTTVTFPGSFTVANGTKVHTVVSAVGDVVNASNYYKIGYSNNDTSTRALSKRNTTRGTATSTIFPYISSTLFHNTVLSLTDSDFAHKVDLYGIATATGAVGSYPKLYIDGVVPNFTGMTEGVEQYLDSTPGGISSTAGTNKNNIGVSKGINKLYLSQRYELSGATSIVASDTLRVSADTERTTTSTSYVLVKDIDFTNLLAAGTIRVKFDIAEYNTVGYGLRGRIYKNGSAVGTERVVTGGTYVTFSEDISVAPGDNIQLYIKAAPPYYIKARNFRIYYDKRTVNLYTIVAN